MEIVNESFRDYKNKFKEIMITMIPLFILQLALAVAVMGGIFLADIIKTNNSLMAAIGLSALGFVAMFAMVLIYMPATIRVFQRREEGEVISMEEAVKIQRKGSEIWKFFKFMVCSMAAFFAYFIVTVAPSFIIMASLSSFGFMDNLPLMILGILLSTLITLALAFIHVPKVIYMFNVYFSTKGFGPMQSVREAIRIGKEYRMQVWGSLLGIVVFGILGSAANAALSFLIAPQEFLKQLKDLDYQPEPYAFIGSTLINIVISIFFTTAIMYIYMSKKYQDLRKMDDAGVEDATLR